MQGIVPARAPADRVELCAKPYERGGTLLDSAATMLSATIWSANRGRD